MHSPDTPIQTPAPLTESAVGMGLPVRLTISAISVDAHIEHLGLTSSGAMAVPESPSDVAWYALGPRPGEIGSAVIAGHVGWKDGTQAVFDSISSLHVGDRLQVEDAAGTTTTFIVRKLRMYDQHQDASNVFGSYDGKAHLNLIGCEGVWNAVTKTYSKRLVVFTDKQ